MLDEICWTVLCCIIPAFFFFAIVGTWGVNLGQKQNKEASRRKAYEKRQR